MTGRTLWSLVGPGPSFRQWDRGHGHGSLRPVSGKEAMEPPTELQSGSELRSRSFSVGWGPAHSPLDSPTFSRNGWVGGTPLSRLIFLGHPAGLEGVGGGWGVVVPCRRQGPMVRMGKADSGTGCVFPRDWSSLLPQRAQCLWTPPVWGPCTQVSGPGVGGQGEAGEDRLSFSPSSPIQAVTLTPACMRKESCWE